MTLCSLLFVSLLVGQDRATVPVTELALRRAASVYPAPAYPMASVQAHHSGRVVIEVLVAPPSAISALARVHSSVVVETPDADMAEAVRHALNDARFMPFFDDQGRVLEARGRVIWEFRLSDGKPEVIDPYAPTRAALTPAQIAAEDLRIVRRARELLGTPTAWNRADNRQCPPRAPTVSLYCALELATVQETGTFEHRGTVMEDARAVIVEQMPHGEYDHLLMGYNNDPATAFADIERVLTLLEGDVAKRTVRR